MENLINSMKAIFKDSKKEDESDKYFYFSPKYNPKVKITDWYFPLEANPKDNDPYHPPGGNYFLSTYRRLGNQDTIPLETTTQAMLRQICQVEPEISVYRPMVTSATDKLLEENLDDYEGLGSEEAEFVTTYNYDFRHPFPYVKRYSLKTELKPQKTFGIKKTPFNSPPDIRDSKFLDDQLYGIK